MYEKLLSCDAVRVFALGSCEFKRESGKWLVSLWDIDGFASLVLRDDAVTGVLGNLESLYELPVQVVKFLVSVKADSSIEPRALLDEFTATITSSAGDMVVRGGSEEDGIRVRFFSHSSPHGALDWNYSGELMMVTIRSHEYTICTHALIDPAWYRKALDCVFGVAHLFFVQEDDVQEDADVSDREE